MLKSYAPPCEQAYLQQVAYRCAIGTVAGSGCAAAASAARAW